MAPTWTVLPVAPDQLGESPFWHPADERLYWVDIPGRRVRRWDPASGAEERWELPQEPGCIAPAQAGGLVLALRDGIWRARRWGGPLELLAPCPYDPATTRFNDGKADPHGRFWAGTLFQPKTAAAARLYCLDGADAPPALREMAGGATTGNGLAWSPDARTLYWADTQDHVVRAWDWDPEANRLGAARELRRFAPKPAGWQPGQPGYGGRPDGAAVDAEGAYWCALYEGGRLLRLSPEGAVLAELATPMASPTMPCFGGPDGRTLYLTGAGCAPAWTRVDVPGLPVNFFIG